MVRAQFTLCMNKINYDVYQISNEIFLTNNFLDHKNNIFGRFYNVDYLMHTHIGKYFESIISGKFLLIRFRT